MFSLSESSPIYYDPISICAHSKSAVFPLSILLQETLLYSHCVFYPNVFPLKFVSVTWTCIFVLEVSGLASAPYASIGVITYL